MNDLADCMSDVVDFLREIKGVLVLMLAVFLLLVVFSLFAANMESRTYNRLTGSKTTWWDACWVELRVQDKPLPGPVLLDNYSFSVGVWCSGRVQVGVPYGMPHGDLLNAARRFSQTNGWPAFNDKEGFPEDLK